MVAVKAAQASALVKSPDPRYSAYLIFGSDPGLVSERATLLAKALAAAAPDVGEVIRLDETDIENDPDRLAIELLTMPMFGGRKIVRIETSRRVNAQMLKPLVEDKALAGILIVEAGNLKRDDVTRVAFEKSPHAAALACYIDDGRDLDSIINEILRPLALSITPGARQMLISRLGADRVMSRGEIEKLALYAQGQSQITEDDVEAVVGDAAELTLDRIVNAAASGDGARAVTELQRALTAGESAQSVILAIQRHFTRLHRIRALADAGKSVEQVIDDIRPLIHFRQKDVLASQCRTWRPDGLETALAGIAATARAARMSSALEDLLGERLVLTLARLARSGR
jgi:DNA polymerase III subunit delta